MQSSLVKYLRELEEYLNDWKRYRRDLSKEDFFNNKDARNMVFHSMLVSIQSAIDAGSEVIAVKNLGRPDTYKDVFRILYQKGIVSKTISEKMVSLAGFRNILVHIYYDVDDAKAYSVFRRASPWLGEFLKVMKLWTRKNRM